MSKYVAGFAFNKDLTSVVMVKKEKPDWQKGKLNAVGGKIENEETYFEAMEREFEEETGLYVSWPRWVSFISLRGTDFTVHFFYSILSDTEFNSVKTMETEEILRIPIDSMNLYDRISNIDLLIDMVLYLNTHGKGERFV